MAKPKIIMCKPFDQWPFDRHPPLGMTAYEPLALLYRDSYYVPDGVLVRHRHTRRLMHYSNGGLRSIDARSANQALDRMQNYAEIGQMIEAAISIDADLDGAELTPPTQQEAT